MTDEVDGIFQDFKDAGGFGQVMVIRRDEMPTIAVHAEHGDRDCQMRMQIAGTIIPQVDSGQRCCLYCLKQFPLPALAAIVVIGAVIQPGKNALVAAICDNCDDEDPQTFKSKLAKHLRLKQITHEAGHA